LGKGAPFRKGVGERVLGGKRKLKKRKRGNCSKRSGGDIVGGVVTSGGKTKQGSSILSNV